MGSLFSLSSTLPGWTAPKLLDTKSNDLGMFFYG